MEHPNQSQPSPSPPADGTPCIILTYLGELLEGPEEPDDLDLPRLLLPLHPRTDERLRLGEARLRRQVGPVCLDHLAAPQHDPVVGANLESNNYTGLLTITNLVD